MGEERFQAVTSEDRVLIVGGSSITGAPVAGDAEVSFVFPTRETVPAADRRVKLMLMRVDVMRATGASTTDFQPQVYNATGASTTAYATKYLGALTTETSHFDVTGIEAPFYTDTLGRVFFKANGDPADTFNFALWFRVLL